MKTLRRIAPAAALALVFAIGCATSASAESQGLVRSTCISLLKQLGILASDGSVAAPQGAAGGDLTGTFPSPTLAQHSATSGQVMAWNGSAWRPADASSGGAANNNYARVALTANLTLTTDGGRYKVGFGQTLEDPAGMVSAPGGITRFTAPVAGLYTVTWNPFLYSSSGVVTAGYVATCVYVNGTLIQDMAEQQGVTVQSSSQIGIPGTVYLRLAATDYVELAYWIFTTGGTPKFNGFVSGSGSTTTFTSWAGMALVASTSSTPAGITTGWITGLKLAYASATTFTISSGSARDSADTITLTTLGNTIDMATTGANGMDAVTAAGTGAKAAGAVTGTGTAFLTAFGTRALTGTVDTSGTTVLGSGTKFLTELRVNDLVGTAANGYCKITSITNDTSALLVAALPGGDLSGAAANAIENPTVKVGSNATTVEKITDNTHLTTSDTSTTVGAGATVIVGGRATSSASSETRRHIAVFLTNLGLIASTQRTTLLTAGVTAQRRIGWITLDGGGVSGSKGPIVPFTQTGSGRTRDYRWYGAGGNPDGTFLNGSGVIGASRMNSGRTFPPGATRGKFVGTVLATAGDDGALYLGGSQVNQPVNFVENANPAGAAGTTSVSAPMECDLDPVQSFYYWIGDSGGGNATASLLALGYTDEL